MKSYQSLSFTQQGMAIVMALVFLLILTLLAVTTTNSTIMAEKMSQNMKDSNTAFQAADAALTDAESWLKSQTSAPTAVSTCSSAPCNVWTLNASPLGTLSTQSNSWWTTNGRPYSSTLASVTTQPRYIIEQSNYVNGVYYYRVTARGIAPSGNSAVTLQSIYSVDY